MNPLPPPLEEKRRRIIEAAVKVFARQGLERGKIADIAAEAGIGKGTIYEYFRSKEEIFGAIIEGFFQEINQAYQPVLSSSRPPVEKITRLIDYSFDFMDQYLKSGQAEDWPIIMEIFTQALRNQEADGIHETISQVLWEIMDMFAPVLREGIAAGVFREVDPTYFALVLFGSLDGLALHYYLQRHRLELDQLKVATREIFLGGILKKEV